MLSDQDLEALLAAASPGPWRTWPELSPSAWKELEEKGVFEATLFNTDGNIAEFDAFDLAQNRANAKLAAQAPALARKVLDLGSAGEALAGAVRPFVDTRVSGGKPPGLWRCPWCRQCSHQPGYIDHREDCKAAAAQSRWAELTKTEERDGT